MYMALGKLHRIVRIRYDDGLKTTNFAWAQWEAKLREMFPNKALLASYSMKLPHIKLMPDII
jgi:hypothetical protein